MPGRHEGALGRMVGLALGAWFSEVTPRVRALAGACPLARLLGVRACSPPTGSATRRARPGSGASAFPEPADHGVPPPEVIW
jgi:hypothetical protein